MAKRAPRRGGGLWGFITFLASIAIVVSAAALVAAFAFIAEANRPGPSAEPALFMVEQGASATAIGQALEREGRIRSELMFRIATRAYARGQSLQAGEYELPASASLREIVRMMAEGQALLHAVTIPEGYTTAMAMRVIAESEVLTGEMPETPPDGAILPETYHVQRGMTRADLVQEMRDARDAAVAEIWAARAPNLPVRTPEEMVILASIVEKETGVPEERPQVAAVFTNRLRIGMALQSDPTIIYGVCRRYPARCENGRLVNDRTRQPRTIRESEIALDTGYNTYRIQRLPPTPIANPGRAALEAVAHPPESAALYFVANGTGGHAFAATVAEHNANVARWREIERVRLAQEAATP
jgi:UPF0755 protein